VYPPTASRLPKVNTGESEIAQLVNVRVGLVRTIPPTERLRTGADTVEEMLFGGLDVSQLPVAVAPRIDQLRVKFVPAAGATHPWMYLQPPLLRQEPTHCCVPEFVTVTRASADGTNMLASARVRSR
jgi:hypothetical protein